MEQDELSTLFHSSDSPPTTSSAGVDYNRVRRRICNKGCGRPINVCLCDTIPSEPLSTATRVVILHHPHESRHKLATVPVLAKCLRNCHTIVGRRLRLGDSPLLDSLYNAALENPNQPFRAIYLFPGTASLPAYEISESQALLSDYCVRDCILIAFDGTWKHAKEMVHASLPFLSKFSIRACLNYDVEVDGETMFDSELILRKEPFSGCMSTLEAVARALRVLEHNGVEIENKLVGVLRAMVRFQACHLKPMKPRPKLLKSIKEDKKTNQGSV